MENIFSGSNNPWGGAWAIDTPAAGIQDPNFPRVKFSEPKADVRRVIEDGDSPCLLHLQRVRIGFPIRR